LDRVSVFRTAGEFGGRMFEGGLPIKCGFLDSDVDMYGEWVTL